MAEVDYTDYIQEPSFTVHLVVTLELIILLTDSISKLNQLVLTF